MSSEQTITIRLNGEDFVVAKEARIVDLLSVLKIDHPAIAVELNAQIMPRDQFETTWFHKGDIVEVVSLVGGG